MTAKSTDVKRPQRALPARASGFGRRGAEGSRADRGRRGDAKGPLDADDARRERTPSAAASADEKSACRSSRSSSPTDTRSKPGRDPGRRQLRVGHLALRGGRRVDDHRVDAAERGGQLGQGHRVDDGPAGLAAARRPRRRASRRTRPGGTGGPRRRAADGWGDRDRGRAARPPDARARPPSAAAVRAWRSARTARVRMPRRTRNASNGPSVAPVSIWTFSTRRMSAARPATTPAMTSLWPARNLVADSTTRSAPSSSGRQTYGEANVLSTM